jgi:large subunit ribosomal protein L6
VSRIGRLPISIPAGVAVTIEDHTVTVTGPKGTLTRSIHPDMIVRLVDGAVVVQRPSDENKHKALHGLTRTLIANMIEGVVNGYRRELEVHGVGYKATKDGNKLVLQVGFSHPVAIDAPPGISFAVEEFRDSGGSIIYRIAVQGIDKELVGETAARIRRIKPPEPYKAKGIHYAGERVRRKAGKAGKVGAKK